MIGVNVLEPAEKPLTKIKRIKMKENMDFKTIYLLTDFSEHARNAAKYAINTFGFDANYVLINSYVIRGGAATLIDLEEIAHQESIENLKNEKETVLSYFPNQEVEIETISKVGSPADVINALNGHYPADMIVVGSKGMSKIDEILIGSVTTAIVRGVELPVLAVPLKASFEKMDQIILASDLNNTNRTEVYETVEKLKKNFGSRVSAATVKMDSAELSTDEKELLKNLEQETTLDDISVLRGSNVSKELMDYCELAKADLLIVVAKHTSFFKRFFHKSITHELVNHEVLPILILDDN